MDSMLSSMRHKEPHDSCRGTYEESACKAAQIGLSGHKCGHRRQELDISRAKASRPVKRNQHQHRESRRAEYVQKTHGTGPVNCQQDSQAQSRHCCNVVDFPAAVSAVKIKYRDGDFFKLSQISSRKEVIGYSTILEFIIISK